MYFKNVFWDGRVDYTNFHLNCDVCGESLGKHLDIFCKASPKEIEPTTFEAHGHTWTRHTPGEPMPCDGGNLVQCIRKDGVVIGFDYDRTAAETNWGRTNGGLNIIAWRFADSAKPEVPQKEPEPQSKVPQPLFDGKLWPLGGLTFPSPQENDEMMCADMPLAAMDDGHLTPGQKAYIQAKEDAQAAKQQLAKDAQDKALQERAGQLADAGKAMDRVNQDHNHKMGWLA